MMTKQLFVLSLTLLIGACVYGQKYDLSTTISALTVSTDSSVTVAVVDHRQDVLNKVKTPDFVGILRSQAGGFHDVTTLSGNSLATDLAASLVHSLSRKQVKARIATLLPGTDGREAIEVMKKYGAERNLLIVLKEWESEASIRLAIKYDLQASVYDRNGTLQGSNRVADAEFLGRLPMEVGTNGMLIQVLGEYLEALLNDPEITAALR